MPERIRDVTVAEAIAAEAGTDQTPELALSELVQPVIQIQPRPPLAVSGYIPGTIGGTSAASLLNTSHVGIFISGIGLAIGRVNWIKIFNIGTGAARNYTIRRVDAPFTGFPSVRATPGYINAGTVTTGTVFRVTKNDTVGAQGISMASMAVPDEDVLHIPGPWIINNGMLLVNSDIVNLAVHAAFGYEVWPAIRAQPPG